MGRSPLLLDDRLLIEELLHGLRLNADLATTALWYFRACRAATIGGTGQLSGPFAQLSDDLQARAIQSLLTLSDHIALPDPRAVVPVMADLAARHDRLNALNLEAVATARVLDAEVRLSPAAGRGLLPAVLDVEGIRWETISPTP